jgi:hypothetical protein
VTRPHCISSAGGASGMWRSRLCKWQGKARQEARAA